MKKQLIGIVCIAVAVVLICNIIVVISAKGRCYSDAEYIPQASFGILFGTGRSAAPSPYYDARVEAAIELWEAGKIKMLIISGENLYEDYNEVDSMAADIKKRTSCQLPIALDYKGTDTYSSLVNAASRFGTDCRYTIISQHFHNQRALFLANKFLSHHTIAFDASDTSKLYWRTRNFFREWLARTKAVFVRYFCKSESTRPESVMDLPSNAVYGETHAYCTWHNRYWEVFGKEGELPFEALLASDADSIIDSLVIEISAECGHDPVYAHTDLPYETDEKNNDVIIPDTAYNYFSAHYTWYLDNFRIDLDYHRKDNCVRIYIDSLVDTDF